MRNRLIAWFNLAYRFGTHVLTRVPARALRDGHDASRFLGAVVPEGYIPLEPTEREAMPSFMGCIHCGLCSIACPALREAPASAWDEAWSFVAGPSRAIDVAALVATPPCTRCGACEAVCPTGVPIAQMAALVTRLSTSETLQTAPKPAGEQI